MSNFFRFPVLLQIMQICWIMMSAEGSSDRSKPIRRVVFASDVQIKAIRPWSPATHNTEGLNFPGSPRRSTVDQESSLICSGDSLVLQFSIPRSFPQIPKVEEQEAGDEDLNDRFTLYLKPSGTQFLHPNATITYQSNNGSSANSNQQFATTKPIIADEVLAYSGTAISEDEMISLEGNHMDRFNNWANILIHHPYGTKCVKNSDDLILEGAFQVNGRLWHIKAFDSYQKVRGPHDSELDTLSSDDKLHSTLVVWNNSDDWGTSGKHENFQQQDFQDDESLSRVINNSTKASSLQMTYTESSTQHFLQKRQTMTSDIAGLTGDKVDYARTIGSTDGCPQSPKMRTFNISLGIVEINIPSESTCPSQPSSDRPWNIDCPDASSQGLDINGRLNKFSKWRSDKGGSDGAGLWHLLTDCPSGSQVGVSWLGALCKVNAEQGVNGGTTSGTGVTASTPNEWETMAHEIGHNFGAVHDCTSGCSMGDSCCPASTSSCNNDDQNIMAPSSTSGSTSSFSACSIGNICSALKPGNSQRMDSSCVSELAQHYTIALNQCGNGILEPGEDCDPGQFASPCCQWGVCKFSPGSSDLSPHTSIS
ncbi:hypothetical protein PTTG_02461 [Puccinia triticina 1-1 BBBD Race 1]|uniref:Peptidase M12B domain-containing protein n=2 Tax=Puccinia triticina TaxID=208348 RepID=A0A180H3M3_PUCT1|nr:uncharacterized protein PtA15_4A335 [Puccinia triticina]OAV98983.1 hypothetical protein PTTG_02461 [Puccinia triticina 1-1 BBBD Race 1]WAQ83886.1 hypothetical protein PtA15_4A335 [Puccinia triticina]WAR54730.1 hypothetical protein PtB15_4B347 [Puccinia triticina]